MSNVVFLNAQSLTSAFFAKPASNFDAFIELLHRIVQQSDRDIFFHWKEVCTWYKLRGCAHSSTSFMSKSNVIHQGDVDVCSSCRADHMGHHFKHAVCFSFQRCFWILVGPGARRPHAKRCASWMKQRCSCRSRCNALSAVCVSALPAGRTATPARRVRRACQSPPSCLGITGKTSASNHVAFTAEMLLLWVYPLCKDNNNHLIFPLIYISWPI